MGPRGCPDHLRSGVRQSQRLAAAPSSCLSLPRAPQGPVQTVPFSSEACHGWGKAGVGTGVPADSRKPAVTEPSPPAPRVGGGWGSRTVRWGAGASSRGSVLGTHLRAWVCPRNVCAFRVFYTSVWLPRKGGGQRETGSGRARSFLGVSHIWGSQENEDLGHFPLLFPGTVEQLGL